jgi:hypothetical protein
MDRLKKRKQKNRYDKFSKEFYNRVQKAFVKIAKNNKKKYHIIDNSHDSKNVEKIIFNKLINMLLINLSDQYELNKKKVKIIYSGGKSGWPGDIFKVNLNINKILRLNQYKKM